MDKGPHFLQQKGDMEKNPDIQRPETYQPITLYVLSLGADSSKQIVLNNRRVLGESEH